MTKLELYDIVTMSDNSEYTIIKTINYAEQKYYLLASIDKMEVPDMENLVIVKETLIGNQILFQEETEEQKLKEVSKLFLDLITNEIRLENNCQQ